MVTRSQGLLLSRCSWLRLLRWGLFPIVLALFPSAPRQSLPFTPQQSDHLLTRSSRPPSRPPHEIVLYQQPSCISPDFTPLSLFHHHPVAASRYNCSARPPYSRPQNQQNYLNTLRSRIYLGESCLYVSQLHTSMLDIDSCTCHRYLLTMQQKEDNVESTLYIFAACLSQPDASSQAHRSPQKHSASHSNNKAASRGKAKWRAWLSGVLENSDFSACTAVHRFVTCVF